MSQRRIEAEEQTGRIWMDPREQTNVPWTKENRRKYTYSKVPVVTQTGRNYLIYQL